MHNTSIPTSSKYQNFTRGVEIAVREKHDFSIP